MEQVQWEHLFWLLFWVCAFCGSARLFYVIGRHVGAERAEYAGRTNLWEETERAEQKGYNAGVRNGYRDALVKSQAALKALE